MTASLPTPPRNHRPATRRAIPRPRYDERLPIVAHREQIVDAIRRHQVIVIAGETGSGKTTHLPLLCLEAGRGTSGIACTQPRRIAATSLARHVAGRLDSPLGGTVGYRIRFDQQTGPGTIITFMTDGILLTDIRHDRALRRFDTIIIDEAHERSINIDFLLGYLRTLLPRRPDLKLIISSATIDTKLFSDAFGGAPIIEVSGRLFPVELINQPLELDEDGMAEHYIEAAVRAVEELIGTSDSGDVLVFMPTERDIAETVELLEARRLDGSPAILPLFGRMPSAQQNRIFEQRSRRAVIVATNIAETSITVPGIRFVVDSGLARTVRYMPYLRTSRMPVEPVPQSSANQRSGRCGRVRDGTCIRLYSREDYESRPPYATPEIRRTNLASAILQMHSLGIGPMDAFPFIEPPESRAVSDGYAILSELGAMTRERELTPLGLQMARLPLDPPISRMILQASQEQAAREVTIIAAGLSVVDPRERPAEKQAEADLAHKRFLDPMSDFLTWLKLWDTYQVQWETLRTQNRMRAFCREHFLSFNRMREWHDVHRQIVELCRDVPGMKSPNQRPASYEAIHRCLLAGLLHNVAMRGEKGEYRSTRDRTVFIFPGSAIFKSSHAWIMCHQVVETSKPYARTAAMIDPVWIESLAPELCRRSYAAPRFNADRGSVEASEQVAFFGLIIAKGRTVSYGRINPAEAHTVFVHEGLVAGNLRTRHGFLAHNQAVREEIERMEAKLRTRTLYAGDDVVAEFYTRHLPGINSQHDLDLLIRQKRGDAFLRMSASDLITTTNLPPANLPDTLDIGGRRYAVTYRFAPGTADDGIVVSVPASELNTIHEYAFEWALPQLWPVRIQSLIEHLPRALRRPLVPVPQAAAAIAAKLTYCARPFAQECAKTARAIFGVVVPEGVFDSYLPEPHAWVRVRVTAEDGTVRYTWTPPLNPPARHATSDAPTGAESGAFKHLRREAIVAWDFADLPQRVETSARSGGMPLFGYPALEDRQASVAITVCSSLESAESTHRAGLARLFGLVLSADIGWEEREARLEHTAALTLAPYGPRDTFESRMRDMLLSAHLEPALPLARTRTAFDEETGVKRRALKGAGVRLTTLATNVCALLSEVRALLASRSRGIAGRMVTVRDELRQDLDAYVERLREGELHLRQFEQYPRYLNAFKRRIELAFTDPGKYRQRREQIAAFIEVVKGARATIPESLSQLHSELSLMPEELAISLFAQQAVGTLYPVSDKRLATRIDEIRRQARP